MKYLASLFFLLVISMGTWSCTDETENNELFFEATINGENYRTSSIETEAIGNSTYIMTIEYDVTGESFELEINSLEVGTYNYLGQEKSLTGDWGGFSPSSGILDINSYNSDTQIIEGEVNVLFRRLVPDNSFNDINTGRFRVQFP